VSATAPARGEARATHHDRRSQAGLTLLEVLVAATLFALFLGAALSFYVLHARAAARGQEKIEVQQNARIALAVAAREIRTAGYDPDAVIASLPTPAAIQEAGDHHVTFLADLDDDRRLDRITFRLDGSSLIREVSSWNGSSFSSPVPSEIAGGIAALAFDYFDGSVPERERIPAPVARSRLREIRSIHLDLASNRPVAADSEETLILGTDVTLRNLR
jgi:prepilin-type N-terminal cleavage/methylation domain-containing protein